MKSLRITRKTKGLTLENVSTLTGVSVSTLSSIEKGKSTAQIITRTKVERELGPINWLDAPMIDAEPRNPKCDWTYCERSFRVLLHEIASLSNEEQKAFCTAAIKHLQRLPNY